MPPCSHASQSGDALEDTALPTSEPTGVATRRIEDFSADGERRPRK
jgi:hypothetical protein